jgi:hypothetical protein
MRYRNAKRLKAGNVVTPRETGKQAKVTLVLDMPTRLKRPTVFVQVVCPATGKWVGEYMHTELREI